MKKISLIMIFLFIYACSTESSDTKTELGGRRYKTILTRSADVTEYVQVTGTLEFWFFNGGVFKQIAAEYVEPQFYGPTQACSGEASGSWTVSQVAASLALANNGEAVTLTYDGSKDVKGLCRFNDRSVTIFLQPSGYVDILDNKRVLRLEVMEKIN